MSGALYSILRALIGWIGRWVSAVHPLPIVAAAAIALLLGGVGQAYELYTALLEIWIEYWFAIKTVDESHRWDPLQVAVAVFAMIVLSAYLYSANKRLGRFSTAIVFQEHHRASIDEALEFRVHYVGLLAALLPWLGMAYGVSVAIRRGITHIERLLVKGDNSVNLGAESYFTGGFSDALRAVDFNRLNKLHDHLLPLKDLLDRFPDLGADLWTFAAAVAALLVAMLLVAAASLRKVADWSVSLVRKLNRGFERASGAKVPGRSHAFKAAFLTTNVVRRFELNWWPRWVAVPYMSFVQHIALTLTSASLLVPIFFDLKLQELLGKIPSPFVLSLPSWADLSARLFPLGWGVPAIGTWVLVVLAVVALKIIAPKVVKPPMVSTLTIAFLAITLGVFLVSGFAEFEWAKISRLLGPLAMMVICCLVIVYMLTTIAIAGQKMKLPFFFIFLAITATVVAIKLTDGLEPKDMGNIQLVTTFVCFSVMFASLFLSYVKKSHEAGLVSGLLMLIVSVGIFHVWYPPVIEHGKEKDPVKPIEEMLGKWLNIPERKSESEKLGRDYPVYIVAAEGGGIYAATTVATFLTRMQAYCGNFAQHVFAISAVSGGAVGSMIFHSVLDDVDQNGGGAKIDPRPCDPGEWRLKTKETDKTKSKVEEKVGMILRDDHLSPLLGLIVPDFLGTGKDRTWGLTQSLNRSLCTHLTTDDCKKRENAKDGKSWSDAGSFARHWDIKKSSPALVLNTTWANVGNRVVYAPFALQKPNFDTLNSFGEGADISHGWLERHQDVSLVEAAVDSARFPGIVPALEVKGRLPKAVESDPKKRWYFVDGGYVDASGTLTAHEMYQTLLPKAKEAKVDLKLIILSSTQNDDIKKGADRPTLKDVAAPVEAFFTVRGLLSRIAAKETISRIEPSNSNATGDKNNSASEKLSHLDRLEQRPPAQSGQANAVPVADNWSVTVVELNKEDLSLELGWKISGLTHDMISMQLGHPELCSTAMTDALAARPQIDELPTEPVPVSAKDLSAADARARKLKNAIGEEARKRLGVARTIRANSCVMASIARTLGAKR